MDDGTGNNSKGNKLLFAIVMLLGIFVGAPKILNAIMQYGVETQNLALGVVGTVFVLCMVICVILLIIYVINIFRD
jgi:hypothetical protein